MFDRIAYRELSRSDSRYFQTINSKNFCQVLPENFIFKYYFEKLTSSFVKFKSEKSSS